MTATNRIADLFRRRIVGYSALLCVGSILGLVAGIFGRLHFLLDMCAQFRVQAVVVLLLGGFVVLMYSRKNILGAIPFAVGIIVAGSLYPYSRVFPPDPPGGPTTRILIFNVLTGNKKMDQAIAYMIQQDPDIIVLQEVNSRWMDILQNRLSEEYPHQLSRPRADNFGIAAFSRIAFSSAFIRNPGDQDVPSVELMIKSREGKDFRIIGTHPLPPVSHENWQSRNTQLKAIAENVRDSAIPTMVCGDLNTTPWSPFFRDFMRVSGLRPASLGCGIPPTWTGRTKWLGLAIDYVAVPPEVQIAGRRVGPNLGSDHRPVIVDFSPRL